MPWGKPLRPAPPRPRPTGWHPSEPEGDVALLQGELDACRTEIDRLRRENGALRHQLRQRAEVR